MTQQMKSKKAPAKKKVAKKAATKTVAKEVAKGKSIAQKDIWADWTNEMAQLSYDIFFATKPGQRWLQMMEERYFYSPVANPGLQNNPVYWAFHTDGHNECLRKIRGLAQYAMAGLHQSSELKTVTRKRTAK